MAIVKHISQLYYGWLLCLVWVRAQAFDALDAWVATSREWTVGGRTKRLMMHSVHGCSRPAAVLCAWMMANGAGNVTLADALSAIQTSCGQPIAAPNFGFVAQLLEYGALHSPVEIFFELCSLCRIKSCCYRLLRFLSVVFRTILGCPANTPARTICLHLGVRWPD